MKTDERVKTYVAGGYVQYDDQPDLQTNEDNEPLWPMNIEIKRDKGEVTTNTSEDDWEDEDMHLDDRQYADDQDLSPLFLIGVCEDCD